METLEVLRCHDCGAPLALADSDTVTCPSCKAVNDVPAAYRELHRVRVADAAARDEAEHVLRALARPPSKAVKVLARVFDQNMYAFLLMYGAPVIVGAVVLARHADGWIARHFHYRSADTVPFPITAGLMIAVVFVCVFVPRVLGVYASRRVTDRARLLAALAARPPTVPGAASRCRLCGAPLAVEPDEILAVCSYCRAENAVHLEAALVARAGAVAETLGREVRLAAARDRAARAATRDKLWHELGRYLLRTVLLGGGFVLASQEDAHRQPTPVAIIFLCVTLLLLLYFMFFAKEAPDERDARASRRAARRRTR